MANPSVHYIGANVGELRDHARCEALWAGIVRQHKDEYGDRTAYNHAVCNDHGRFFVGRGWGQDSAANGVDDDPEIENLDSRALLVMVGPDDEITDACVSAIRKWANEAVDDHGMDWPLRGHKTYVATSCPGDRLMAVIAEINANHDEPKPPKKKDDDPMLYVFNPHNKTEIWCLAGNTRRHVTPDEWKFAHDFGGINAAPISAAWFDSYPVAA